MNKIAEKLSAIQSELKAPKGQYNNFGNYRYRSCEDILEALKPILRKHGCTLYLSDEPIQIGERYYIRAAATVIDTESGESLQNTAYAREDQDKKGMDGSQITGTSSSYARKYALNGLFCIDDTKDADTDEYIKGQKKPEAPERLGCRKCGKPIKGLVYRGAKYAADDVEEKWGLCPACFREAAASNSLIEISGNRLTFGGGDAEQEQG